MDNYETKCYSCKFEPMCYRFEMIKKIAHEYGENDMTAYVGVMAFLSNNCKKYREYSK